MAIRKVRVDGDDVLRMTCKQVPEVTNSIKSLIKDMFETMYSTDGVGLAAPQIGIVKRIVVIDDRDGHKLALINPVITSEEGEQDSQEGCLSIPNHSGIVKRPQKITVEALNEDGEKVNFTAEDFFACVCCHELDHLDGVLYKDKAFQYQ